jgi:hypothetical protein
MGVKNQLITGGTILWAKSPYFVWVSTILSVVQDFAGPSTELKKIKKVMGGLT